MYDTIHFWLTWDRVGGKELTLIPDLLERVTEHRKESGESYVSGYIGENLKVSVSQSGLSIKGSLAKYYLKDNFQSLNRGDSQRAMESLSDALKLNILESKVTRFDIAQNFNVQFKPEIYFKYLGDCQSYTRLVQPHSLYYNNGLRTKLFYNKVTEGKAKGNDLPKVWNLLNKNIFRYELRFTSRMGKQFSISELKASDLINESFYISLLDRYCKEYESISKIKPITFNLEVSLRPSTSLS